MEPERPIEKLLRAYAKKRREDVPPPELHPANRHMLHSEIASRARKPVNRPWSGWLMLLRPRLALIVCIVALALISVWLLAPWSGMNKRPQLLTRGQPPPVNAPALESKKTSLPPASMPPEPARRPRATPAETSVPTAEGIDAAKELKDEKAKQMADVPRETDAQEYWRDGSGTPTSQSATFGSGPRSSVDTVDSLAQKTLRKAPGAPAVPATTVVATGKGDGGSSGGGLGGGGGGGGLAYTGSLGTNSQRYRLLVPAQQVAKRAGETAGKEAQTVSPPQVLTSFRIEQAGKEIKVVDSDGSVYSGFGQFAALPAQEAANGIAASSALDRSRSTPARAVSHEASPAAGGSANYYFRVSGTNRTLNQQLVFTASLVMSSNTVPWQAGYVATPSGSAPGPGAPLPLNRMRVTGHAVLGDNQSIPIDAVPRSP